MPNSVNLLHKAPGGTHLDNIRRKPRLSPDKTLQNLGEVIGLNVQRFQYPWKRKGRVLTVTAIYSITPWGKRIKEIVIQVQPSVSNLVLYAQSTTMVTSGQTWCFTPSQPLWLHQGKLGALCPVNHYGYIRANLVLYAQSTTMVTSGQTWCFTPSQPLWLHQGKLLRPVNCYSYIRANLVLYAQSTTMVTSGQTFTPSQLLQLHQGKLGVLRPVNPYDYIRAKSHQSVRLVS